MKTNFPPSKKIGILGGGQLGKMLASAAQALGQRVHIFTDNPNDPALFITPYSTIANYKDFNALASFVAETDLVTIEFENIPLETVEFISQYKPLFPSKEIIKFSQNRILEKQFLQQLDIPVAEYSIINSSKDILNISSFPTIIKTATLGYDGKGQFFIQKKEDINLHLFNNFPYIAECYIKFVKEISIIVVRDAQNNVNFFPIAENTHVNGILRSSKVPAAITELTRKTAQSIAYKIATSTKLLGIMAIEFFVCEDGSLLVNELAPRPHNSGHWSLDACSISQFEQTIRAILGWPLKK